jgi:ATP-dependent Lhr-like helicase
MRPVAGAGSAALIRRRLESIREGEADRAREYDLPLFLSEWLAFYGPLPKETVVRLLGLTRERLDEALVPLVEGMSVVADVITEEQREIEICDAQNLETLLRMARRFRRPAFQPLPAEALPLFLATMHGIPARENSRDQDLLQQRLEQLFGWPAPARAWEEELLPARIGDYRSDRLDSLMQENDLIWFGCGERKVSLAFRQDLELFRHGRHPRDEELNHLIPDHRGRYSFLEIAEFAHLDTARASDLLWKEAWKGSVTSDSFRTIRKGIATGFKAQAAGGVERVSRRAGFSRWKQSRPVEGHWLRIDESGRERDILEEEELVRDRVRQLLRRHGLLFRELTMNELQPLQWRSMFRSLRLMELSGEVLSGYFFEGLRGPQFVSHEAFRMLGEPLPESSVFWVNATDPASLCGLSLNTVGPLPPRVASTHLVYHGSRLAMVSKRLGKDLDITVGPDHRELQAFFRLFKDLLTRDFNPPARIVIETINGEAAALSPYATALRQFGFRPVRQRLELWKEY